MALATMLKIIEANLRLRGVSRTTLRLRNGATVSSWDAGAEGADPIVLVHGLGTNNVSWSRVIVPLARDHRVYAPDLPGFGRSTLPPGRTHFDISDLAAALTEFLATLPSPPLLVGQSLGAWVCVKAARARPDLADQLVLVNPAGVFYPEITDLRKLVTPKTKEEVYAFWRRVYHRTPRLGWLLWKDAAANMQRAPVLGFLDGLDKDHFINEDLPRLEVPTSLLWGSSDRFIPVQTVDTIVETLGDTRLHWIPDCGHVPPLEAPKEFVRIVRQTAADSVEQRPRAPAKTR